MHLESKFTMSLVFATPFFWGGGRGGGGGGVPRHLVVQTNFEFKISEPLVTRIIFFYFSVNLPSPAVSGVRSTGVYTGK